MDMPTAINKAVEGQDLSKEEMIQVMHLIMTGKSSATNGRTDPFRASLSWITQEENFAKIADETYHDGPI